MDIDDELRKVDRQSQRNEWRLDALDQWREVTLDAWQISVMRRLVVIEDNLDKIIDKNEVTEAVSAALKREHYVVLTYWQKALASFVGVFGFAAILLGIVASLKSLGAF